MKRAELSLDECAIAQALSVVGDPWTLLIIRDAAAGCSRFNHFQASLLLSRRMLAERLHLLVAHGVLQRHRYLKHPPRYEYQLSPAGNALLPVLMSLQDWGARWVSGDGTVSATTARGSAEARRVRNLVGRQVPPLELPSAAGTLDPVGATKWTVLFCFPGVSVPPSLTHPPGWAAIPGAIGCSMQTSTFRDEYSEFTSRDCTVVGVSTQRPDELASFVAQNTIPFALASDAELRLASALCLPTFRVCGVDRLKRLTLIIDRSRAVRGALFPISDVVSTVGDALKLLDRLDASDKPGLRS
jgi:DNA-binding HxlR family transcriptional regulator/peroxiredoxin